MTTPLSRQLGVGDRELIAIVGAGGKSTLLFALGGELVAGGRRVILTTTTKMARDQVTEPACWSDDPAIVEAALVGGPALFVAQDEIPGKITGPSPEAVNRLFGDTTADYVVVEADGARSMSIKAPAAHEPAIPSWSTLVIVVVGIDAVGRRVVEAAHRPDRVASLTGLAPESILTVRDVAAIISHPDGGLARIPEAARTAIAITKVTPTTMASATELETILAHHPRITRVVTLPLVGT